MPTYEYQCNACGKKFEKFQPITAAPIKRCPACGKSKVQRLIGTGAGMIFKGSGFYITDYRSDSYKEKAKAESGSSDAKSTGSSESKSSSADSTKTPKTEPKPAAKADSKPAPKKKAE